MLKNPFLNATCAALYIVLIALFIRNIGTLAPGPDNIFAPMVALSLLTFSVALMGLLIIYPSMRLLISGEKEASLAFLVKTLSTLAGFILVFIILLILF
jgi:hypothetical protein